MDYGNGERRMTDENPYWRAFKEAFADTGIAFCINVPLNFALVAMAFELEFSALQTSIMLTTIFTIFALTRKTYIRVHFEKRYAKKQANGLTDLNTSCYTDNTSLQGDKN
jgi:hypothetical protein